MDAMDTSPSSPVWAQDVDVFTSPDRNTTEAARQKGLGAIVAMLNAGELQFLDLLRSMESCLVTTDDARRARGVLLLAEAVTQYGVSPAGAPKRAMPKPAAELLAQFFASKLEDFAVIRAALMGCTFLLNARSGVGEALVTHETARTMADKLFEAVHVPSLVQGDRFRSYEMLLALCSHPGSASPKGPPLGSQSPQEQLEQLIASCDGEKDPRNVLLVCELWKHVPLAFCGSAGARAESAPSQQHKDAFKNAAEELYDVVAAYFPVSFRPPPGDAIKVTHDELASTLRDAMCASPTYAPYAVPHVLESVDSEKAPLVVADALASLAACGAAFGKAAMKPHVPAVWSALRQVLLRPPAGSDLDAEGAAKWATRLFAANWSGGDGGAPDGSLAAMALCDPCLGDAATALAPSSAKTSGCCGGGKCGEEKDAATKKEEDAPHEHTHGGGCCGGEEEESGATSASAVAASSNATEVTNRGHAIVAAAGRVLGAVAAAGPAAAKAALATGVSPLLDAAGIGEDGDVSGIAPGVAPLALVLATPATCGALDGASRHDESSSGSDTESVLGTTGARLVCLFAAAATKSFAARKSGSNRDTTHPVDTEGTGGIDTDDGAVLGVAGLRTLLSFPKGFGLTETSHVNDALLALCAAATASDDDSFSPERAHDLRVRAGEALGAAASFGGDAQIAFAAETVATPNLLTFATDFSSPDSVEKARRALQALARVVHSAPVTRRVVLAPLCDAVVERAANMAGSGETHSLAFAALADALAGVDGGVSVLLPLNTKTGLRTPGILQTAAMTADSVSSDTSLRAALLAAALLHAPGRDANAFACSETVADAACRLTRAAVAACDAVAQGPLLLEAERVVMRRHAEAIDTRQGGTSSDTRLDATYTPLNDASMDASLTTDGCSANDAAFRVATATFEGARPDVSYPLDTAAGVAVTSALAFLATLSDTQTTPKSQLAASHALCSLVHKRGASGTLGGNGGLDAAIGGGVATVGSLGLFDHSGPNAAGGVLRALAQRGDPSSRVFAKTLVALLSHENRLVAANAARALGEAMRSGGGGAGAMRVYHGVEKPLFRQKFFAQTLPDVLAVLQIPNRNAVLGGTNSNSSGIQGNTNSSGIQDNTSNDSGNKQSVRPAALSAVVHLSRHAPGSAAFAAGLKILPLLPEAARVLSDVTSPFHDADALAAAVVLIAGFFADPRGRNALETHADANAGAMLRALCELAASRDDADDAETQNKKETQTQTQKRETTACLEVRETSLEALVAATSLPFSCVYPYRKEVTAAATMALDDPKRRVRRAAARCREVWLALDTKT